MPPLTTDPLMTHKAFWDDPYATQHRSRVVAVAGAEVVLESSIFFAFSGGQESDRGSIGGRLMAGAAAQRFALHYTLAEDHGLAVGDTVEIVIDGARRLRLMRLHFAAELVLELFYRELQDVAKVGAHIAEDKARIDFVWPHSIAPMLPAIADRGNAIIAQDLPIHTGFDDRASERRYWAIEGFSKVPCGGTHVRSTGEIGPIRLKRNNIGKGKERVEIYLAS